MLFSPKSCSRYYLWSKSVSACEMFSKTVVFIQFNLRNFFGITLSRLARRHFWEQHPTFFQLLMNVADKLSVRVKLKTLSGNLTHVSLLPTLLYYVLFNSFEPVQHHVRPHLHYHKIRFNHIKWLVKVLHLELLVFCPDKYHICRSILTFLINLHVCNIPSLILLKHALVDFPFQPEVFDCLFPLLKLSAFLLFLNSTLIIL